MADLSRKSLILVCRDLGSTLEAGLPVSRALAGMATRARHGRLRLVLERVAQRVQSGASLAEACRQERCFPPLFLHVLAAGEQGGALGRVLQELTRFYEFQQALWRRFLAQIALPVLQYVAAVAVISLALHIISTLGGGPGMLTRGLLIGYGAPAGLVALYVFVVKPVLGTRVCHEVVLRVPVLGAALRRLALARFSLVMYVMIEAPVPLKEALARSMAATGNGAFAGRAGRAVDVVQQGSSLTSALVATGLFPGEYIEAIDVAEESGKLSEQFNRMSALYAEKAEFAMKGLAIALAWLIWAAVAAVIITFIVMIFTGYVSALQGLSP